MRENMASKPSRERIFDAAIALFAERGYRETTVGDIEDAAGLTRRAGGFYRHFASKEEILVQAVNRMAEEMIADIRLEQIVALKSPRAELFTIARALMQHAATYRPLRLILQREGYKLPALRRAARRANERLGTQDVVPWIEDVLRRSGVAKRDARELGLLMFGPVLLYILSLDRGDPAFGLKDDGFLDGGADRGAGWLERGGRA
jgi:AcrR family transcriptional regulator